MIKLRKLGIVFFIAGFLWSANLFAQADQTIETAMQTWTKYMDYCQATFSGWELKNWSPHSESGQWSYSPLRILNRDDCFLSEAKQTDGSVFSVQAINSRYAFRLALPFSEGPKSLFLDRIGVRPEEVKEQWLRAHQSKNFAPQYGTDSGLLLIPACWLDFTYFADPNLEFEIIAQTDDYIDIRFSTPESKIKQLVETHQHGRVPFQGTLRLSKRHSLMPLQLKGQTPALPVGSANPRHQIAHIECEWEYEDSLTDGLPMVAQFINKDAEFPSAWAAFKIEVVERFKAPFPEETFRLTAYDFPEPPGLQPKTSFPRWAVFLIAGTVLCSGYWFVRRRNQ